MSISRKISNQTLACSSVILAQILIGLGWGWIAPTLVKLRSVSSTFKINAEEASWLASINEIGRIIGSFISPMLVDKIGRKYSLVLISIMYLLIWTTIAITRSVYVLCSARIVFGIANGINDVLAGIYTVENCSSSFRGIIGGIVQLSFSGSLFIEFFLATYLSYENTAIVNAVVALFLIGSLYFSVETPYFLVMKDKHEKAKKTLIWLRGGETISDQHRIIDELAKIKESVREEKEKQGSIVKSLSSLTNLKAILVVVGIHVLGVATGGGAFTTYASLIFSPTETLTSSHFTILFGISQFIIVLISPFFIEKINRRTLIVTAFFGQTCSNLCSFVLFTLRSNNYEIPAYPWFIFVFISMYGLFGGMLAGAVYAVKGELLPLSVRALGSSMAIMTQALTSFIIVKIFFPIYENYGMEFNFLIYSIASLLTTIFVYVILPETRGKSLHEIRNSLTSLKKQQLFGDGVEINKMVKL